MVDFCHICHQHWHHFSIKVEWSWGLKEQESFQKSKDLLLSSKVLVHFDPKLPVALACDASHWGSMAHKMPDGTEKPIGFALHTLSAAEQQYSQIEQVDVLPSKNQALGVS